MNSVYFGRDAAGGIGGVAEASRRFFGVPVDSLTLDQAALNILRLSAPFEPFPRQLAAKHDALRITYEWQFLGGDASESTVRMPADTQ